MFQRFLKWEVNKIIFDSSGVEYELSTYINAIGKHK